MVGEVLCLLVVEGPLRLGEGVDRLRIAPGGHVGPAETIVGGHEERIELDRNPELLLGLIPPLQA
jgi:hypothetical protein